MKFDLKNDNERLQWLLVVEPMWFHNLFPRDTA